MGYEIKLIIGKQGFSSDEIEEGGLMLSNDGQEAYRPYLKNENGEYIKTGRTEKYFSVYAIIDLCKPGYDDLICKMSETKGDNKDERIFWYFYIGNEKVKEDCYGKKMAPVKINDVIHALQKDLKGDKYRRYKWALALLRAMKDDPEELEVLFYGY